MFYKREEVISDQFDHLGMYTPTKTDEFSEKFRGGGGAFPIQKFMLQNLGL